MITSKNDDLLANATIGKTFCRLAIPAVAAQLINILYNLVDKMFIGHIPDVGSQALAGVGVTTPVILVISAFAALVSMGGAPKATIFMGKGQHQEAEKVLGSCTWMLVLLSLLLTLVMLLFEHPVLMLFGASNETIGFASDYMRIYCLGTLFTQLTLGLNAFITAQGNTFVSMYNVAIGAISNILLDAVFINTFGMGVKGAALATIISQGMSAGLVIYYLCSGKSNLHLQIRNIRFDKEILDPCILLGTSPALMQLTENLVAISFNTSLQKYGGDVAVASMSILTTKKQEYGVLQAVGMTNKQLNLCLQLQGLIFTVGTICVALIVGLPLGYALFSYAKHNGIFGMNVYHVPITPILAMILLVGLLQIVLSLVLSSNLKKETLVERIRYQG